MRSRDREAIIREVERVTGGTVAHFNDGSAHRRMLLWNRRFERAYQRSLRNQPPRSPR